MSLGRDIVLRTRQNHALEHATMHLLAAKIPGLRLVGRSDWNGFSLYGNVDAQAVVQAVTEGFSRIKAGQIWLAVHPRCGSNIAVGAALLASAFWLANALPARSGIKRWLNLGVPIAAALALARPGGLALQRHITTTTELDDHYVATIQRHDGPPLIHRVSISWTP
jgi:hypothetical protein